MFYMKILHFTIFFFFKIFSTNAIICWQCNAKSERECRKTGYFQECWAPHNKFVCHTKVTRNQAHLQIIKGCKEAEACIDERRQMSKRIWCAQCFLFRGNWGRRAVWMIKLKLRWDHGGVSRNHKQLYMLWTKDGKSEKGNLDFIQSTTGQRDEKPPQHNKTKNLFVSQNWGKLGQCSKGMQSTCRCCCFKDFCNEDTCVRAKKESCRGFMSPLNNGSVRCSDVNNVGSTCRFRCPRRNDGKNIALIPNYGNTITCLPNGEWSSPIPNCRETCGPNVRVDFIVLGQRATVAELLGAIRRFIPFFLNAATVEPGYMHFTSLRYRTHVHQPVLRFVDSITKNDSEIIEFFANLPVIKDDTGPVNTGAALWYVYNNIINKEGDRPNVTNFLMLDTAAVPNDDAITPARALRKAGVVILPRFNPGPETNYEKAREEMTAIAGYRSKWFLNKNSLEWSLFERNIYCRLSFPPIV